MCFRLSKLMFGIACDESDNGVLRVDLLISTTACVLM